MRRMMVTSFMNKFYQCLLASRIPQKIRKLVVTRPQDSGKTSRANVFRRIISPENVASVMSESQFSAAMITKSTQLILVDEWSARRLDNDMAETLLQRDGW